MKQFDLDSKVLIVGLGLLGGSYAKALSKKSVDLLLINLVAPLYYAYSGQSGDTSMEDSAMELLTSLEPENNSILNVWAAAGIKADNAFRSQALIHLRNEYCDARKCLYCRIGNRIMRSAGKK